MSLSKISDNQTVPAGKLYFNPLIDGSYLGYQFLGNAPSFGLSVETTFLDHVTSTSATRQTDKRVPTAVSRTGNPVLDDITPENLELFLNGEIETYSQAAAPGATETLTDVRVGRYYDLGETSDAPMGVRDLSSITVIDNSDGTTEFTEGTDYEIDVETGMLRILQGGAIVDGDALDVSYDVAEAEWLIIKSSDKRVVKGKLKLIADNTEGENLDHYFPEVTLSPGGELTLINDGSDWQQLPFELSVLTPEGEPAIQTFTRPGVT